jgi:hypothetical protein
MHTKIKMSVSTFDTDSTAASAHMGYDHKIYELHDKIKKINEKFTKNFGSLSELTHRTTYRDHVAYHINASIVFNGLEVSYSTGLKYRIQRA